MWKVRISLRYPFIHKFKKKTFFCIFHILHTFPGARDTVTKKKLLPSHSLYPKGKRSPTFKQENTTILENKCYEENKMLESS